MKDVTFYEQCRQATKYLPINTAMPLCKIISDLRIITEFSSSFWYETKTQTRREKHLMLCLHVSEDLTVAHKVQSFTNATSYVYTPAMA